VIKLVCPKKRENVRKLPSFDERKTIILCVFFQQEEEDVICVVACLRFAGNSQTNEEDREGIYEIIRKDFGRDCDDCRNYRYVSY